MFASKTLTEHVARGVVGIGSIVAALALVSSQAWISPVLLVVEPDAVRDSLRWIHSHWTHCAATQASMLAMSASLSFVRMRGMKSGSFGSRLIRRTISSLSILASASGQPM